VFTCSTCANNSLRLPTTLSGGPSVPSVSVLLLPQHLKLALQLFNLEPVCSLHFATLTSWNAPRPVGGAQSVQQHGVRLERLFNSVLGNIEVLTEVCLPNDFFRLFDFVARL